MVAIVIANIIITAMIEKVHRVYPAKLVVPSLPEFDFTRIKPIKNIIDDIINVITFIFVFIYITSSRGYNKKIKN